MVAIIASIAALIWSSATITGSGVTSLWGWTSTEFVGVVLLTGPVIGLTATGGGTFAIKYVSVFIYVAGISPHSWQ
jgi:hypothetical protein